MENSFCLDLPGGPAVPAVRVTEPASLPAILAAWGLGSPRPTLVVVGGAGGMTLADEDRLWPLFLHGLAPLAHHLDAALVDGGTDAGVMRLIGRARAATGGTFPLLGVVPDALLGWPAHMPGAAARAAPAPHHTHFVLVPGTTWGAEAPWLAAVATALAGTGPSVTLVVNGGAITLQDALYSTVVGRRVLAVAGSGRVADALAGALLGLPSSPEAARIAASGLLQAVDLSTGPEVVTDVLREMLAPAERTNIQ